MGCKSSKNADPSDIPQVKPSATPAAAVSTAPSGEKEKPRPLIFALMRNGHEVIRGAHRECKASLEAGNVDDFKQQWADLGKWTEMHMYMEEGKEGVSPGFFALLNSSFDDLAKKEGLHDAHPKVEALHDSLETAIKDGADATTLKDMYEKYVAEDTPHLEHEEKIMMPKVMELKKSGVNLKEKMANDILPAAISGDFKFFVQFAMKTLEKHSDGSPRARVFAHALWGVATAEQWQEWEPWIKESLSPELYADIAPLFENKTGALDASKEKRAVAKVTPV